MTAPIYSTTHLAGFDESALAGHAGGREHPGLLEARQTALRQFVSVAAPTGHDDEWRRTDPELFPMQAVQLLPVLAERPAPASAAGDEAFDVIVDVDDDGVSIRDVSGRMSSGDIRVSSFRDAGGLWPDAGRVPGPAQPRSFTALAAAFWNVGLLIHVPRGRDGGSVIVRQSHTSGRTPVTLLSVCVEDCARLQLAHELRSPDGVAMAALVSRHLGVGRGALLKMTTLQAWGNATRHVGEDWSAVGQDGTIEWVTALLGGAATKQICGCDVCAPNAEAFLSGMYFGDGDRHYDLRTVQQHTAPNTSSHLLYKGVAKDRAHSVYQGVIAAAPGAIKVDAYQMNNNLVLTNGARADSLPGLQIDADDLKCSHGATTGNLDEEQLFFLRSRGLDAAAARQMLIEGFFEEVVSRMPFAALQAEVREHVAARLK